MAGSCTPESAPSIASLSYKTQGLQTVTQDWLQTVTQMWRGLEADLPIKSYSYKIFSPAASGRAPFFNFWFLPFFL